MRIIGLICEYNPFHNGHLYQINKIKDLYPDALIITIVSTNFTLRGEISIINKWHKTEVSLNNGVDIVLELPTLYATQSADMFAYGALAILNKFKIDTLVFGSETNDIELLKKLAYIEIDNPIYNDKVKEYLSTGMNYKNAMSKSLYDLSQVKIDKPNDLLGLSYIKEIIKNKYPIEPVSIKRTNEYYGKTIDSDIVNASLIREMYNDNLDISSYLPKEELPYLYKIDLNIYYKLLSSSIFNNKNNLDKFIDIDEGIDNRIIKYLNKSTSLLELVNNIKTKRYTTNKINRALLHILLNMKKENNNKEIYLRLLGFNDKGKKYLNKIKKNIELPIYTLYKPNKNDILDIEYTSTFIYSLIVNDMELINKEFTKGPIIYK